MHSTEPHTPEPPAPRSTAPGTYHPGERAVQERAGVLREADNSARAIKGTVPAVAARFLAERPMVVVGAADAEGRLWCSLLTGPPGFATATDDRTVRLTAGPRPGDPLHPVLARPTPVGTLAIDPATRRRMRMNGTAAPTAPGTLEIALTQVYANCNKYIQKREPSQAARSDEESARPEPAASAVRTGRQLTTAQQVFVRTADTFFLATADPHGNADASHRGGDPGFVEVLAPDRLRWPDYAGNAMFHSLGNIAANPRCGLLLPDWETGTTLQLTGTARIDWAPERAAAVPGAERLVEFAIEKVVESPGASPLRWGRPEYSRFNPRP